MLYIFIGKFTKESRILPLFICSVYWYLLKKILVQVGPATIPLLPLFMYWSWKKYTNTCYFRIKYNILEGVSLVNCLGTQCSPTLQEWLSNCPCFRYRHTLVYCIFFITNKFRTLGKIANILLLIFIIINHVLIICITVWDTHKQFFKIYIIHFFIVYWNDTWHVDIWQGASFSPTKQWYFTCIFCIAKMFGSKYWGLLFITPV